MAHIVIEHSDNLGGPASVQRLVDDVHRAAHAHPRLATAGLRTRAVGRGEYRIADGADRNAFVAITVLVGPEAAAGASEVLESLLDAAEQAMAELAPHLLVALSAEVREIDPRFQVDRNHIRHALEEHDGQ